MNDTRSSGPAVARPAEQSRGSYRVLRRVRTRWADNGVYWLVRNVHCNADFDTAVNGWLMTVSGRGIRVLGAIGMVAGSNGQNLRPVSFPDTLHSGLALETPGSRSVICRTGLLCNDETELSSVGRNVHVDVDALTRRPVNIPAMPRAAMQILQDGV
jgi:acyl-CoA thioester hydrolase